ncbi:sugar ABC transporter substrate-binding protein [Streptomyces hygroscopicus]|uniref:extracellular solute-binding protein n=1 Tax=Streptomyces hygroscopicus TaxID=1912 RepID=UPI00223EB639|nr:extracellular solute-binding protein [Streptomyces hygroscopicus]MCW7945186.1 sugar ABC transporter substrate-binding protein [Streptomyces hygroscopicus]
MSERTWHRRITGAALATACLAAVAACAPGPSAAGGAGAPKTAGPVSTDPAADGKVTLTEWDQNTDPGVNASTEKLNAAFMAKYPNVKIKRVSRAFNDLKTTLKLALSSNNPPDVVQANQGYPDMGAFVKAGLLQPVDRYAQAYGWPSSYPQQLLSLNKFTADGRTWKTGNLYGVSQTGEIVGVYYNKDKLKQLGIAVPTTLSQFETALQQAKAAGDLPISFGNSNKSPAIQLFGVVQALTAGKQEVRNLVFSQGGAKWTDSGPVQTAGTLQDWVKKGYLSPGFDGQSSDQAVAAFAQGKSVFMVDGSWQAAALAEKMDPKSVGFIALAPSGGASPVTQGGEGLAWAITSKSKHADVAAAYINFLVNDNGMKFVAAQGNLPAIVPGAYQPPAGTIYADLLAQWKAVSGQDGLLPYLDYTTPTFYDTLTAALQEMLAGQQSPQKFGETLQNDDSAFQKSR